MKNKLHEYNIPSCVNTEILDDIFGKKAGAVYLEGLVDAIDIDDFDAKTESLLKKWTNSEHTSTCNMEGFISWFQTFKAPVIHGSMIRPVREECGLGSLPAPFKTNASKTANYMLNHKVNCKQSELPEFLQKLKELVHEQEREVEEALLERGKYEMWSKYQSWHISECQWFAMTTAQWEQHLKRFPCASVQINKISCKFAWPAVKNLLRGHTLNGGESWIPVSVKLC